MFAIPLNSKSRVVIQHIALLVVEDFSYDPFYEVRVELDCIKTSRDKLCAHVAYISFCHENGYKEMSPFNRDLRQESIGPWDSRHDRTLCSTGNIIGGTVFSG